MLVFFQTTSGDKIYIDVDSDDTLEDVYAKLYYKVGLEPIKVVVFGKTMPVSDDKFIATFGVDARAHVIKRPEGYQPRMHHVDLARLLQRRIESLQEDVATGQRMLGREPAKRGGRSRYSYM
jgi:hypothetical protein